MVFEQYLLIVYASVCSTCLLWFVCSRPSIISFVFLNLVVAFLYRPVLVFLHGSTVLTQEYFDLENYMWGIFWGITYFFTFSVCAIIAQRSTNRASFFLEDLIEEKNKVYFPLLAACFLILIFLYIGGTEILFFNRSAGISTTSPSLRYVFPFLVALSIYFAFFSTVNLLLGRSLFFWSVVLLFSFVITIIVAQRGFFITSCIIASTLYFSKSQKNFFLKALRVGVIIPFVLLALMSKRLMISIASSNWTINSGSELFSESWLIDQLRSPDGDASEVWMLLMDYLSSNSLHFGETIFYNIFNFLGHNTRASLGYFNGQDLLNGIYTGNAYWSQGFGFNVPLFVELHLNLGGFGLIFAALAGLVLGRGVTVFENHVVDSDRLRGGSAILFFYALYTVTTSFSGLQYAVLFCLIGILFRIFKKF